MQAVEDQAIQRVHRIGQTKTTYVRRFVVDKTVEQRILELHSRKKALASSLSATPQVL
jgi:DNA repair protein RAD5